jgi:hypothetical protein
MLSNIIFLYNSLQRKATFAPVVGSAQELRGATRASMAESARLNLGAEATCRRR